MTKKAIAYASDIILGRTGEVIGRIAQKEVIRQYAQENDIEIVAWFEDEQYDEDVARRKGVCEMLAYQGEYDCVLIERVWCFSRSWKQVKTLIDSLSARQVKLEATSWLWDCVSVLARHHTRKPISNSGAEALPAQELAPEARLKEVRISRPIRLNFFDVPQN